MLIVAWHRFLKVLIAYKYVTDLQCRFLLSYFSKLADIIANCYVSQGQWIKLLLRITGYHSVLQTLFVIEKLLNTTCGSSVLVQERTNKIIANTRIYKHIDIQTHFVVPSPQQTNISKLYNWTFTSIRYFTDFRTLWPSTNACSCRDCHKILC